MSGEQKNQPGGWERQAKLAVAAVTLAEGVDVAGEALAQGSPLNVDNRSIVDMQIAADYVFEEDNGFPPLEQEKERG